MFDNVESVDFDPVRDVRDNEQEVDHNRRENQSMEAEEREVEDLCSIEFLLLPVKMVVHQSMMMEARRWSMRMADDWNLLNPKSPTMDFVEKIV